MNKQRSYSVFVIDDDQQVLALFKKHFAGFRHLASFCASGGESQAIMAGVYPDMVVSRLGLSDMDGSKLLEFVEDKHPNAIRIIYGMDKDEQQLVRLVANGTAHRYFCLPWERNGVAKILHRDLMTRMRLRVHNCWNYLDAQKAIPVLPEIMKDVQRLLSRDDYALTELAGVIERDPGIAASMLQVVNSSAFPKQAVISNLAHAVTFLGLAQTRELLIYICTREVLVPPKRCVAYANEVARHSYMCGKLAAKIARVVAPGEEKSAATAGLLHDLGKLILFTSDCARYMDTLAYKDTFDLSSAEFEFNEFGLSHSELGSSLMLWWNLPMTIIETAANHNRPVHELWGVPKCVAIADRCLLEVSREGEVETDLGVLAEEYPLASWRRDAVAIYTEKDHDFARG